MLAFSLLGAVAASSASANSTLGSFEIDGNLLDDSGAGEPIDWSTPPPNRTMFSDLPPKPDDDIFEGGSKELQQSGWDCGTGSAPGKDDIVSGELAFRTVGTDQYAYVNFFRDAVNGDAHMDYEFNKSTLPASADCPQLPRRTVGDILIAFDTENGGATIMVRAFTWSGVEVRRDHARRQRRRRRQHPAVADDPRSWRTASSARPRSTSRRRSARSQCGEFSGAYMKTRAATAINAALKDFTEPQPISPGVCPPSSAVSKAVRNATTNPAGLFSGAVDAKAGDAIDYRVTYTNSGAGAANGVVVTDTIAAGQTYVADSCLPKPCSLNGQRPDVDVGHRRREHLGEPHVPGHVDRAVRRGHHDDDQQHGGGDDDRGGSEAGRPADDRHRQDAELVDGQVGAELHDEPDRLVHECGQRREAGSDDRVQARATPMLVLARRRTSS